MARREFQNQDVELPNGDVMRVGTYMGPRGELAVKLRLPSNDWHLSNMFRAAEGANYDGGKTVIVLDRSE